MQEAGPDRRVECPDTLAGKYLAFTLGAEEYALPVLRVREIIRMMDITAVPQVPRYVRGVINLRGKVIPVADLRLKFEMAEEAYTGRTAIVVVEIRRGESTLLLGVVVDAVSEVLNIASAEIEEAPHFGSGVRTDYLRGMAKTRGRVTMLLDLDRVFGADREAAQVEVA